jgi:hypothetical protein
MSAGPQGVQEIQGPKGDQGIQGPPLLQSSLLHNLRDF